MHQVCTQKDFVAIIKKLRSIKKSGKTKNILGSTSNLSSVFLGKAHKLRKSDIFGIKGKKKSSTKKNRPIVIDDEDYDDGIGMYDDDDLADVGLGQPDLPPPAAASQPQSLLSTPRISKFTLPKLTGNETTDELRKRHEKVRWFVTWYDLHDEYDRGRSIFFASYKPKIPPKGHSTWDTLIMECEYDDVFKKKYLDKALANEPLTRNPPFKI